MALLGLFFSFPSSLRFEKCIRISASADIQCPMVGNDNVRVKEPLGREGCSIGPRKERETTGGGYRPRGSFSPSLFSLQYSFSVFFFFLSPPLLYICAKDISPSKMANSRAHVTRKRSLELFVNLRHFFQFQTRDDHFRLFS